MTAEMFCVATMVFPDAEPSVHIGAKVVEEGAAVVDETLTVVPVPTVNVAIPVPLIAVELVPL